jgi:hypothetical protein
MFDGNLMPNKSTSFDFQHALKSFIYRPRGIVQEGPSLEEHHKSLASSSSSSPLNWLHLHGWPICKFLDVRFDEFSVHVVAVIGKENGEKKKKKTFR